MGTPDDQVGKMKAGFYRAFEERWYAPREVIRKLRLQYLPFIEPVALYYRGASSFDAGCGRGEWLEICGETGLQAAGVDLDEGMLQGCWDLGLNAIKGDAIEHICALPDNSQAVVSAFHVVEHIAFDQLRVFIAQALRVLKPGGLLIMETPNAENVFVATRNFYLDPTHQRPIPAGLLSFVTEFEGFGTVRTIRLQEPHGIVDKEAVSLWDVFASVSPDYAVVGKKSGCAALDQALAPVFGRSMGVDLETLLKRWDRGQEEHVNGLRRLDSAQGEVAKRIEHLELQSQEWADEASAWRQRAVEWNQQAAEWNQQAAEWKQKATEWHARSEDLHGQLLEMHQSTSWRLTKPLRAVVMAVRGRPDESAPVSGGLVLTLKRFFRPFVAGAIRQVFLRPGVRRLSSGVLKKVPWLHQRLLRVAVNTGTVSLGSDWTGGSHASMPAGGVMDVEALTPRARQIFADLKCAIDKKGAV